MRRSALLLCWLCCVMALGSALHQRRFKRQSSGVDLAGSNVDKNDLEALKVKIVRKFLLAVLFSAQNDEKRTNETKVRASVSSSSFSCDAIQRHSVDSVIRRIQNKWLIMRIRTLRLTGK